MMVKVVQILLLFAQGLPDCALDVVDNVLLQVSSALVEDKEVHEDDAHFSDLDEEGSLHLRTGVRASPVSNGRAAAPQRAAVLIVPARAAPMPHGRLMPHEDGSSSLQIARENTSHGWSGHQGSGDWEYTVFPAGKTRCSFSKDDVDDPGNS